MSLTEVSSILWRERELLDLLLFKLEEEQLLLAAGRSRWLGHATREVEMVLGEMKRAELGRAVEVEAVAVSLGLAPTASLRELATPHRRPGATSCASTAQRSSRRPRRSRRWRSRTRSCCPPATAPRVSR
jgi:hypothetical protein